MPARPGQGDVLGGIGAADVHPERNVDDDRRLPHLGRRLLAGGLLRQVDGIDLIRQGRGIVTVHRLRRRLIPGEEFVPHKEVAGHHSGVIQVERPASQGGEGLVGVEGKEAAAGCELLQGRTAALVGYGVAGGVGVCGIGQRLLAAEAFQKAGQLQGRCLVHRRRIQTVNRHLAGRAG